MNNAALLGYTGFVGGNLLKNAPWSALYNTKNIHEIDGKEFELVVCSAVSAVKWMANAQPEADKASIDALKCHLKTISCKHFVLISTVDIYTHFEPAPDEDILPQRKLQDTYGSNRYELELWCQQQFAGHCHVLRLPALFGEGLKKNFLFDWINPLPSSIIPSKWGELCKQLSPQQQETVLAIYDEQANGNLSVNRQAAAPLQDLALQALRQAGFTSLCFTDSRSQFPFFDLSTLLSYIEMAIAQNIPLLNVAVPSMSCSSIIQHCFGQDYSNELIGREPVLYDMKSKYAGPSGYFQTEAEVITRLKQFFTQEGGLTCV